MSIFVFLANRFIKMNKKSMPIIENQFEEEDKEEVILTEKQAQKIESILDETNDHYDELINQGDPDSIQKTIDWLKLKEEIEDTQKTSDGIWIKFKAGEREAVIFIQNKK